MTKVLIIIPFLILVPAAIVSMFRSFAREKARRRWLRTSSYAITCQAFEESPHGNDSIIFTNFGFGPEVWYLPTSDEAENIKTHTYIKGKVIITENILEIQRLCKKYNIKMTTVARKPHWK